MTSPQLIEQASAPVFAPDGSVRLIPNTQLPDAMSNGGKLAVQMKAPDGSLRYVPHDQVGAAQKAGGVVNTNQGTPSDPVPQEGFWHSLGSVFGLTPEQLESQAAEHTQHPIKSAFGAGLGPGAGMVASAIQTAPAMARKAGEESNASYDSLKQGHFLDFLAHQIGGMGYTAAALASPLLGDSPAKAGEQLGAGNVKGALGTTTGLIAPVVVGGAVKGKAPTVEAPNVFEGAPPAEIPAGRPINQPGLVNRAANAVANANLPPAANFIPKVVGAQKLAKMVAKFTEPEIAQQVPAYSNTANAEARGPYRPYPGDLTVKPETDVPGRTEDAKPEATPQTSAPSTIPRTNSGEGVLNQALTGLDNKTLLKVAKSRGLDVGTEAQLKPGKADARIIGKIMDSFSEDELDNARNIGIETSRNTPMPIDAQGVSVDAAKEAWRYKVLNTFFPDVSIPKAMQARVGNTLAAQAKARFEAARVAAESKANAIPMDAPQAQGAAAGANGNLYEQLRQSLIQRGIKPPF